VGDPDGRADCAHETALHQCVDTGRGGGRERVLGRAAQQRGRICAAGLGQLRDQVMARGGREAVDDRTRDRCDDAAHQDQHQHRERALGDDEHHRRETVQGRRTPQQLQRPHPGGSSQVYDPPPRHLRER
jgi:hypothetical protein